jgi:hypothetical protein
MSLFGVALADHLAETLNVSVSDVTDSLNTFLSPNEIEQIPNKNGKKANAKANRASTTTKKVPEKKEAVKNTKAPTKTVEKKNKPAEKHTCERIKRGQTDHCGKNATKSIGTGKQQKWFCGTEKAGCYSAELNAEAKKNTEKKAVDANVSKVMQKSGKNDNTKNGAKGGDISKKTNEERKIVSDNKSKSLVHSILGNLNVNKKTINGKLLYIERTKRILYDFENNEFYGILDKDNKTVLPIPDDIIKWIETHGQYVRQNPNVKLQDKHKSRDKVMPQKEDVKNATKPKAKVDKKQDVKSKKVEIVVSEEDENVSSENIELPEDDSANSSVDENELELPEDEGDDSANSSVDENDLELPEGEDDDLDISGLENSDDK